MLDSVVSTGVVADVSDGHDSDRPVGAVAAARVSAAPKSAAGVDAEAVFANGLKPVKKRQTGKGNVPAKFFGHAGGGLVVAKAVEVAEGARKASSVVGAKPVMS